MILKGMNEIIKQVIHSIIFICQQCLNSGTREAFYNGTNHYHLLSIHLGMLREKKIPAQLYRDSFINILYQRLRLFCFLFWNQLPVLNPFPSWLP